MAYSHEVHTDKSARIQHLAYPWRINETKRNDKKRA